MSREFGRAVAELMGKVGQEMVSRMARRTPVRTGAAQQGWKLTNVSKDGFEIENDVEYVTHLENGTVHMKPHHMVRSTMEEAQQIVDQCVRKL
ncbi:HK97 gp10 family phage protein [Variovorax sp. J22R193]|uniref:HK97 gp10 family phage protein n=1 Tax=Variovorax fucosicus TaxID=3053517 RepID=UPI0025754C65|nr:HK97 gp10 family phage protein [Variovorax sp. J22R193]MDM0042145.1 HK97 gp10 family phage protein [Variovorax sp. J22R193]